VDVLFRSQQDTYQYKYVFGDLVSRTIDSMPRANVKEQIVAKNCIQADGTVECSFDDEDKGDFSKLDFRIKSQ